MLVLSRKLGETIVIDGNIKVEIVQVDGQRVRLGITAPRDVPIRRSELAPQTPIGEARAEVPEAEVPEEVSAHS